MSRWAPWMADRMGWMPTGALRAQAREFLEADGHIGVEIGFDQKRDVTELFRARGFDLVDSAKDLGGNDRVLIFGYGSGGEVAN